MIWKIVMKINLHQTLLKIPFTNVFACKFVSIFYAAYCWSNIFAEWLEKRCVRRLVVVIRETETNETLERWQFEIQNEETYDKHQKSQTKYVDQLVLCVSLEIIWKAFLLHSKKIRIIEIQEKIRKISKDHNKFTMC